MYLPDSAILISVSCTCLDSSLQARAASTVAQSSVHVPLTLTHTQLVSESVQSVSSPTVQTGTCKKVVLSIRQKFGSLIPAAPYFPFKFGYFHFAFLLPLFKFYSLPFFGFLLFFSLSSPLIGFLPSLFFKLLSFSVLAIPLVGDSNILCGRLGR